METSLVSAFVLVTVLAGAAPDERLVQTYVVRKDATPRCEIDRLVFGRLKELGIQPAGLCSDGVFVRRVYLDVIGTLPTAEEAKAFLLDTDLKKRQTLIDHLLERKEFADYWALKWSDLLRVKAEFPVNLWPNAAQAYYRWIHTSLAANMPYDKFVRTMLLANGSNFRVPQVNFYRAVQKKEPAVIAQAVALTFMGTRAENWPKEKLDGMGAFFARLTYKQTSEWKEEIVFYDHEKAVAEGANSVPKSGVLPDGTKIAISPDRDPREEFADWLISPKNPWFNRNIVNRVWCWLLGRGIIHEADDIRPDNPPCNPELLAYLESELVKGQYDLKHVFRLILNSNAYQLSSIPRNKKPEAAVHFAQYPLRRLEAEVLIDALNQITGTSEVYSSPIPEPFTFIPEGQRSVTLPDGSITSSFLEQFGRPSRDTGLESERNNRPTAEQRLHMLNSSHIQRKLEGSPKFQAIFQLAGSSGSKTKYNRASRSGKSSSSNSEGEAGQPGEVVTKIYLTILSRFPTEHETQTVGEYIRSASSRRDAVVDLVWALVNSAEFMYRH